MTDVDRSDEYLEWLAEDERRQEAIRDGQHPDDPGPPEPAADRGPAVIEALAAFGDPEDQAQLYSDVAAFLDGTLPEPPVPVLLNRADGHALMYAGRVNASFGDPETGKTWVALAACVEALRAGRRVLVMDLDHNGMAAIVGNLLLLGAPVAAMRDPNIFRHCEPDDGADVRRVVDDCTEWRPAVAVIDSIGELLPMLGMSSNDGDEYTMANARVLQPLADNGVAVITIDHLAKSVASRAIGQGGAVAKRRALGGTSIRVRAGRQFIRGKGGSAELWVNKDRHGGVREWCPPTKDGNREQRAGTFVLDPADANGAVGWRVLPPVDVGDGNPDSGADLDNTEAQYLQAARTLASGTFTAAQLAVAAPGGDVPPTESQTKRADRYAKKLVGRGWFEVAEKGARGGSATRWRLRESNGQINSANPHEIPLGEANPTKSHECESRSSAK